MKKTVRVGSYVHKQLIVVATGLQGRTEAEAYGQIGGMLEALASALGAS